MGPLIPDIDRVSAAIDEVAATEIMPRFRKLAEGDIRKKHGDETVTVADEAAERALTRRLHDLLPGSLVVGEEAAAEDRAVLDRLAGDDPVWVIDPIDGTRNFASGKADFGVMVALVRHDEIIAGWIHHPVIGRLLTAERGSGAWIGSQRISVPDPPADLDLVGSISYLFFPEPQRERLRAKAKAGLSHPADRGCIARHYSDMALGRQHFGFYRNMKPWDHLAGALILREAGGRVAKWDGSDYRPRDSAGGILAAASAELWTRIRAFLATA
ncbi:MAG: inositol monophosphatase [Alphaproteobacteria bacterium]|nr:inositol monophosphatase [Alphaproteobacteria bacterium]